MVEYFIVGGGIVGLAIARALKSKYPLKKVVLVEKENVLGAHSSGRNSGVLHAGFYYAADTLKAKFSAEGNCILKEFCVTRGLKLNRCGKLVIAKDSDDLLQFATLMSRAKQNGVELFEIDESEALKLEPRVKTYKKALWSPNTATVDPVELVTQFADEVAKMGVDIHLGEAYLSRTNGKVRTNRSEYSIDLLVNAAGLYADKIAHQHGLGNNYRILPFKGIYLYCDEKSNSPPFKRHIYPVPNLSNPFLGVHHTLTVDGRSKIGPTAIPALWREQYNGLERFRINEFFQIIADEVSLFFNANFNFRQLALEEMRKYLRSNLIYEASKMATGVVAGDYKKWGRPGIRAQLFEVSDRKLKMDFCIERNENSLHVLNAISPAFTCALPFADWLVKEYL